jgi:hypothetical protein
LRQDSVQAGNAVLASTAGDDCFALPAEADVEPLADQDSADAGAAVLGRLVVSGDVHAVSELIVVCGLFPRASAAYLELLVSADAASPHSGPRKWLRSASETVQVHSIGLAVASYGSQT